MISFVKNKSKHIIIKCIVLFLIDTNRTSMHRNAAIFHRYTSNNNTAASTGNSTTKPQQHLNRDPSNRQCGVGGRSGFSIIDMRTRSALDLDSQSETLRTRGIQWPSTGRTPH